MSIIRNSQALPSKFRSVAAFVVGGTLALAMMSQPASADTLHGFCWGGATCADNGTNTPTSANPPMFGFAGSGQNVTGDLVLDFLIPDNAALPTSISVTGTVSGTAMLFSTTPWTSGQLAAYLGISASPANPIGAFGAGGVTGYDVYQVNLGTQTLGGTSNPTSGPEETSSSLPLDSYIVAFLNTAAAGTPADWSATANSGAILETGTPSVPEPSSLLLLGTSVLGAAGMLRRKYRS